MLQPGIKAEKSLTVTDANTAKTMGSGTLDVFATPAMVALIESELEPGWGSVGTSLNIQHLSATPVGMTVTATTELVEVDRRRLVFHAEVYDEKGLVGKGTHERFLVENEKFQAKADAKNQ